MGNLGSHIKNIFVSQNEANLLSDELDTSLGSLDGIGEDLLEEGAPITECDKLVHMDSNADEHDLILAIYMQSESENLSDLDRSIYKVEEFLATLPKELPDDAKKKSIQGIIQVAGLTDISILQDASDRIQYINEVKESTCTFNKSKIEEYNSQIEEWESQINSAKENIFNLNAETKKIEDAVALETRRISTLTTYIK